MKLPSGFRHIALGDVGSTNDEARRLVAEGTSPYTIITATRQNRGRGRYGRDWVSEEGNLFASLILSSKDNASRRALYGFVMAVAIGEALNAFLGHKIVARLKWPNDVQIAGKKIAGILLEVAASDKGEALIIGFGVNCAHFPNLEGEGGGATSLSAAGNSAPALDVLAAILGRFLELDALFEERGFEAIRERWLALATGLNQPVKIRFGGTEISGIFSDLGWDDGAMLIKKDDGSMARLTAGEAYFPEG